MTQSTFTPKRARTTRPSRPGREETFYLTIDVNACPPLQGVVPVVGGYRVQNAPKARMNYGRRWRLRAFLMIGPPGCFWLTARWTYIAQRARQIQFMDSNDTSEPREYVWLTILRGALQWLISRD